MKIPVYSPTIRRREMDAVLSCLVSEKIGPGELNMRLIQQVKDSFHIDGCAAVRSPAIALKYALKAVGLPPESGIMLSALAPDWQYVSVAELGYKPVVLDVSAETAAVTAESIEDGISRGGRLLLVHETLGLLPDFDMLASFGLPIIEDISQSAGAYISLGESAAPTAGAEGAAATESIRPDENTIKRAGTFGVYSILGLEEQDILTAGGGAVVMAPGRREWIVLKKLTDEAPVTDILPDINSALAFVQLKERERNEKVRREMYDMYIRPLMQSRHKSFVSGAQNAVQAVYSFPVVLSSGLKDVKQYAARKEIDIIPAFEKSIIAAREEELAFCIQAKSLFLRCVLFPLYPRLGMTQAAKIAKVLATLP